MANATGGLRAAIGFNTVHLCIDMQRLFSDEGPWPTPWMPRVLPMVIRLVAHAPQRTVFTRFMPPRRAEAAPGRWRAYYDKWPMVTQERIDPALLDILPELRRHAPPAHVVDKAGYSAFGAPALLPLLQQHHVDTLIATGSETDVCVLASVLAAIDLGYRVIVARDAVCSSSDAEHDALIELYARRFDVQLELADTDEIIAAWETR
jgi:nicotinamidase-related amidase